MTVRTLVTVAIALSLCVPVLLTAGPWQTRAALTDVAAFAGTAPEFFTVLLDTSAGTVLQPGARGVL